MSTYDVTTVLMDVSDEDLHKEINRRLIAVMEARAPTPNDRVKQGLSPSTSISEYEVHKLA